MGKLLTLNHISVVAAAAGDILKPSVLDAPESSGFVTPLEVDYHTNVGIPTAARIKAIEDALDFEGSRIIGGTPANLGHYPHAGGLDIRLTNGASSVCGCVLLTNTRVVTAAHYWRTNTHQGSWIEVVFASQMLYHGGTRVGTNNVETHSGYNVFTLVNDIAVIRLPWVTYNNHIQPIGLATGNYQYVGTWAWTAGFGQTRDGQPISYYQVLSHAMVQVMTNAGCAAVFGTGTVRPSTICASTTHGSSTYWGDSGGPLQAYSEQLGWHLIGVVSFGHVHGCQLGYSVGFARVTYFANWIRARL